MGTAASINHQGKAQINSRGDYLKYLPLNYRGSDSLTGYLQLEKPKRIK